MDEESKVESFLSKEKISHSETIFRRCHYAVRQKISKQRRHPNEGHFNLKDQEEALSFNWDKFADVNRGNILLGLSYTSKNEFQNYKDFVFFKYPCEELLKIEGVERIEHDPVLNGNPSSVGFPNNKSHSLVFITRDDPEVRLKLASFVEENYDSLQTTRDEQYIDTELEKLYLRKNETPYHKLWEFD